MEKLIAVAAEATGNGGTQSPGGGIFTLLVPLIVVFFVMYWLMIRPQKKAEQKRKEMIGALVKGDWVVTVGGVYGQVTDINEKAVVLKVDQSKGVELKFLRESIRGVERKKSGEDSESETG